MRRKIYVSIAVVVVALVIADYFILGIMQRPWHRSLLQERASRLIDEANYCTTTAECFKVPDGRGEPGTCIGGARLVNIKEADRIPALCQQAWQSGLTIDITGDRGMDNPRCEDGHCISSSLVKGVDGNYIWMPEEQRTDCNKPWRGTEMPAYNPNEAGVTARCANAAKEKSSGDGNGHVSSN